MKPKRGDVREDGMVFWKCRGDGYEWWVPPSKIQELRSKANAKSARYKELNKEKERERHRLIYHKRKDKKLETQRRRVRRKLFSNEDGSSFDLWIASVSRPNKTFEIIANLQPDPGQTLAELIHKLSGYAMDVCEQIANPPVIEDAPPAKPTPQPDLF
jgi:hypothetical protein